MTSNRQTWLAFLFLVLAQFMIVLDGTIVTVALPSIQQAFHLSLANLQWIVTAYSLAFGGFLLLGGRTADIFGRKRVFLAGLIGFTAASLLIGLLPGGLLIAPLRAVQGLAAAYASPAALSMVLTLFSEPHRRTKVLSIWSAVSAAGGTFGLLAGGIITEFLGWRWNFFVNVPIGMLVIIGASLLLPAHTAQERTKKLDIVGGVLVTAALMLLVYTIANGDAWGWVSWQTLGCFALCVVLFVTFIANEQRAAHPLLPLSFFRIGNIASANAVMLFFAMTGFPPLIMLTLYNQSLNHYSPLQSGLAMVPLGIVIGGSAMLAPKLIKRFGFKRILVVAPLAVITGMLLFMQLPAHVQFLTQELPGSLIWPLAVGPVMVSLVFAATAGVPAEESGLASGMVTTFQQIGFALGLALLSSVAASQPTPLAGYHQAFLVVLLIALALPVLAACFIRQQPQATA
jgi:EmrB/QacA subfamily drug resistance transporter